MKKKRRKASSIAQRNLMGYAYACATGKTEDCPSSIKNIANSFMKKSKRKGIKSLRDFASTKHIGLPYKKNEQIIIKFENFMIKELREVEDDDVISYLYSLNDVELTGFVNDFITANKSDKKECMDDIISEIEKKNINPDKYNWILSELKKM